MTQALALFSAVTRAWFRQTYGEPTPPQAQGWLPIQRGEHTLILAPTGSGKTLAAFLWGIDELFRTLESSQATDDRPQTAKQRRSSSAVRRPPSEGIQLLYVSPLKALNNDIERNLQTPLQGIREFAAQQKIQLPRIRVAVRTGDTPAKDRAAMLKYPPHILITTPESLYLMLTSPRARELFRTTRTVIVDEIHMLAGDKRGVHLALSLERLQRIANQSVQRIGLSATIQPLDEVAKFLGGQEKRPETRDSQSPVASLQSPLSALHSRPITIVDARYEKKLELKVVTVVDDFRQLGGADSIWARIIPNVLNDIREHQTTLIFSNSRRLAERTADRLNAQLEAEESEEIEPGSPAALAPGGVMRGRGIFALGAQGPIRAHHGSMSKETRHALEEALKAGKLPALIGTSSLELGIDIGAVDLVVQLQSPKSVAQGLQRVGRSGHLVGQTSHGKIYATFREDLAEAAAIARGMLEGAVEPTHTPQNALDVLAQQIVACVAMEEWDADELYQLARGAYPYRQLTRRAYEAVLDMLAGKYYLDAPGVRAAEMLRPKIAWDKLNNRLRALPGSRLLALSNVGTIPDTGQYKIYLDDNKTRLGELDEEFVFETRPGDTFLFGSQVWRALEIKDDRVLVEKAPGATPRMPFWRGDAAWRPFELGERIGKFRRDISVMLETPRVFDADVSPEQRRTKTLGVLQREYALDEKSARNLIDYVEAQIKSLGAISSDKTIIIETFQNAADDPYMVIHSPFGGRVNGAWAVALNSLFGERAGIFPETLTNDDGIIFRFNADDPQTPLEWVTQLAAPEARERILRELPESAVFGARFRMNAARALLLTKPRAGQRAPFWLQRLKAKDLLALAKRTPEFPILVETYRDVLSDVFDLPHLELVLDRIASGEIQIVTRQAAAPSPVAAGLLFNFVSAFLYEWDAPKAERKLQLLSAPHQSLQEVMQGVDWSELLKPDTLAQTLGQLRHTASDAQARTREELYFYLRELGDLTTTELRARSAGDADAWLRELAAEKRISEIDIPTRRGVETRWVSVENANEYQTFAQNAKLLKRLLAVGGPITRARILERYAFDETWLDATLTQWTQNGASARGHFTARAADEYIDAALLEQIHRRTLTALRAEAQPVSIFAYADFLARWQRVHPETRLRQADAAEIVLKQLRGVALAGIAWERDILRARIENYSENDLDALMENGAWIWVAEGNDAKRIKAKFFARGEGALFLSEPNLAELSAHAQTAYEFLKQEGASFGAEIQSGTNLETDELANALTELARRGLVTNDELGALRDLIEYGAVFRAARLSARASRQPISALEQELNARLGPRPLNTTQYREAQKRARAKAARALSQQASSWRGRWTLARRAAILGAPLSEEARAAKWARVLLERYGVVTRAILEREEISNLNLVYAEWQRMEWRGQARRGIFVADTPGAQYALPEAVEQLRAASGAPGKALCVLNATDPANVFGGAERAWKFARVPSTYVTLWRGQPVLIAQEHGERLTAAADAKTELVRDALQTFFERANAPRHIVVTEWNGENILGSHGEMLLQTLGFYRTPKGMERWTRARL